VCGELEGLCSDEGERVGCHLALAGDGVEPGKSSIPGSEACRWGALI